MIAPDELTFRAHVEAAAFRGSVAEGRWWLLHLLWPNALIAVKAANRPASPDAFVLKFELTNYPVDAPTGCPWNASTGLILAEMDRPKGDRVGMAFRTNWEGGRALYIPCDRIAIAGHTNWPTMHRQWRWTPGREIAHYLRLVHELLNDDDYQGV